jgi:hypothetical protein
MEAVPWTRALAQPSQMIVTSLTATKYLLSVAYMTFDDETKLTLPLVLENPLRTEGPTQSAEIEDKQLPIARRYPTWTIQEISYSLDPVSWMTGAEPFLVTNLCL